MSEVRQIFRSRHACLASEHVNHVSWRQLQEQEVDHNDGTNDEYTVNQSAAKISTQWINYPDFHTCTF